ncbi:MFS transporter [Kribbella sp. NPDC051586]|uniref:MFS transporter n=1 Tax=Kribbella sp. NPDC051586 TaxID=3364118 RepID=UPI0037B4BB43
MLMLDTRPATWRRPVAVLSLGAFAVGTDAFVIAGMLPDISASLDVSVAAAGQLVTVFAISYALLAPVLAAFTGNWSRRTALVAALITLAVGNAITALAPSYGWVLAARVVAAAGASLYTAGASATAASLAGDEQRGRAIALVMTGLTASLALGAPLGTAVGAALGWRATLWAVALLALLIVLVLFLLLPDVRLDAVAGLRARLRPLRDRRVLVLLGATVLAFIGIYMPYTYVSAVYGPAVGTDGTMLALVLLLYGVAGTAGNLLAGHLADRFGPRRVVLTVTLLLTVVFCVVPAVRSSFAPAIVAVVVNAMLAFMVTTPQQHQMLAVAPPGGQAVVTALYQASGYLAVSLSGAVGGLLLSRVDAVWLTPVAACFVLAAALLIWLGTRRPTGVANPGDAS